MDSGQDEFTCTVCLDTLTDPVTLHCGHSFCLKCLTDYWDQSQECICPQCRHIFIPRPELHRNNVLDEVIKKLKKTEISPPPAGPGDVKCDVCTGKKFRAVKSCLTCTLSFCQTHLWPHCNKDALKDHKLINPDGHLMKTLCTKDQKCLEFFCKSDEVCAHILQEVQESEESFTNLICYIKEMQKIVTWKIREQEMSKVDRAQKIMKQLEKEMEELRRRDTEMTKLLETDDCKVTTRDYFHKLLWSLFLQSIWFATLKFYIHFFSLIQACSSLDVFLKDKATLKVTVPALVSCENMRKEILYVKEKISSLAFCSLLSDSCPLTLDPSTGHRHLTFSEVNRKVTCHWKQSQCSFHPDRFDFWPQVLCGQALSGTRFYWEVEWNGLWASVGVTYKGIGRNSDGAECRLGYNNKSWSLFRFNSRYLVCHNNKETVISAARSPRIGVYLDYPSGSLSFYSISDTMIHLYTFKTTFTEPLYPGFEVGLGSSVTICYLGTSD
uniref:Uncharacterized protein n=1 Tax=Erpetoichthys calabaricus TaxID=27687 RepID=A0A8C4TN01_ERPCA